MILLTGAGGVLGSAFRDLYKNDLLGINGKKDLDLRSQKEVSDFFSQNKLKGIIHLAAISGGMGFSGPKFQATLLRDNILMLFNILDNAYKFQIKKTLVVLSSGMYPPNADMPYRETDIHNGQAHESSYGYFYAKRIFEPAVRSYRQQFGMDVIGCVPNGIFGPNDNFSEFAPMLPSIIKRAANAIKKKEKLEVWGDGEPLREYTYSYDMAKAMMWCYKNYSSDQIINVGSSEEMKIRDIVEIICKNIGLNMDQVYFNTSKPNGVMKKSMDNSKFVELSDFEFNRIEEGIKKTIEWFKKQKKIREEKKL